MSCMDRNYNAITFISKHFYFKQPILMISQLQPCFIEATFTGSKKVKRTRNYVVKRNPYLFLDITKIVDFQ